jgi:hypothetical protein
MLVFIILIATRERWKRDCFEKTPKEYEAVLLALDVKKNNVAFETAFLIVRERPIPCLFAFGVTI